MDADATSSHPFGLIREFNKAGDGAFYCATPIAASDKDPETSATCELEGTFDASGRVINVKRIARKCELGCGEFRPLLEPGEYRVVIPSLRVRETADEKSKHLFNLTKDQKIQVAEDTHKIVTIGEETAPWVKIKTPDGKEGYVFGGYIRGKDEPYIDLSNHRHP